MGRVHGTNRGKTRKSLQEMRRMEKVRDRVRRWLPEEHKGTGEREEYGEGGLLKINEFKNDFTCMKV